MSAVGVVAKKELRAYFTSPIAYAVMTVFLVLTGFFFYSLVWWLNSQPLQAAQNPYYAQQMNINQMVFAPLFSNMSVILLLMVPLLTMRLFAEEKKIGTEELLWTSPVKPVQVVLGKFLASFLVLGAMLALAMLPAVFTFLYGNPEVAPLLNGYLGLWLMGGAFLAIGLFFSSLTENQIVAAILTFGALLLFWILNWAAGAASGFWKSVINYVSFFQHFENSTQGILDTTDLIYYLSLAFFGLFMTHSVIQSRRWR